MDKRILEEYVTDIMELVDRLGNKCGELISYMNSKGYEVDDAVFNLLDDLKDGFDDVDEAVSILIGEEEVM